jgi:hypothetical protein
MHTAHRPNMAAILVELGKAKRALTQKHSFRSIEAFDCQTCGLKGAFLFDTMMIALDGRTGRFQPYEH